MSEPRLIYDDAQIAEFVRDGQPAYGDAFILRNVIKHLAFDVQCMRRERDSARGAEGGKG